MKHSRLNMMLMGIALAALTALSACTTLGLQQPTSPEDGFRYSQTLMTGIYNTLGTASANGTLPAADARSYYDRMEAPYRDMQLVDQAVRVSGGTVPTDMVGRLNLAMTVLNQIAAELKGRLPAQGTATLPAIVPVPAKS